MGIDVGARRIGIAISDATRTLARPLTTIEIASGDDGVARVLHELARLASEDEAVSTIVVGVPLRLDGSTSEQTSRANDFITKLKQQTSIPVIGADERLTSVEAESRLALRTKNWRDRKKKLDAAAAAVILQDYLDNSV